MGLLKDIYNTTFYKQLANSLSKAVPGFNSKGFLKKVDVPALQQMELKARMRHTTVALHEFLDPSYPVALKQLSALLVQLRKEQFGEYALVFMFLPDYVECYGLDDYKNSVKAIEEITQFITCEFAVRPFLIKYGEKMVQQMLKWSTHKSEHVRRLASEGSRPKLPWAMVVPDIRKNPEQVLPILENLKNDPSPFVRKSVANNLNDISKDHPAIVLGIAARWQGISPETNAIIKHGARTLLKRGNPYILSHYNLESTHITAGGFTVHTPEVTAGEHLEFSFNIKNTHTALQKVRLEYAVYYRMAKDKFSKKVFRISERDFAPGEEAGIKRKQSFKVITTRRFYPGEHQVALIVNGEEKEALSFVLLLK